MMSAERYGATDGADALKIVVVSGLLSWWPIEGILGGGYLRLFVYDQHRHLSRWEIMRNLIHSAVHVRKEADTCDALENLRAVKVLESKIEEGSMIDCWRSNMIFASTIQSHCGVHYLAPISSHLVSKFQLFQGLDWCTCYCTYPWSKQELANEWSVRNRWRIATWQLEIKPYSWPNIGLAAGKCHLNAALEQENKRILIEFEGCRDRFTEPIKGGYLCQLLHAKIEQSQMWRRILAL